MTMARYAAVPHITGAETQAQLLRIDIKSRRCHGKGEQMQDEGVDGARRLSQRLQDWLYRGHGT